MIKGTTSSGFSYTVDERINQDFRLVRAYKKLASGSKMDQVSGAVELVSVVLGSEAEEDRFLRHLAEKYGVADTETVYKEIKEILEAAKGDPDTKK